MCKCTVATLLQRVKATSSSHTNVMRGPHGGTLETEAITGGKCWIAQDHMSHFCREKCHT
jgi:hypothetical protein